MFFKQKCDCIFRQMFNDVTIKKTRLDLEKGEAINLDIQGDFLLT